jgi:uncharacterized membrane protein
VESTIPYLSPYVVAAMVYLVPWIGVLIVIFLEKRNKDVLTHAFSSLLYGIMSIIAQIFLFWSKFLSTTLWLAYFAFNLAMVAKIIQKRSAAKSSCPFCIFNCN